MFFSVKVAIDKCTELESKLNCVRPAKITKRRRSEYTPIQSAAKRSRSNSEPQIDLSSSYFEDDGLDLVSNEATELQNVSDRFIEINRNLFNTDIKI